MNAKINKVCKVVIQICSVTTAIAQVVAAAFPVPSTKKSVDQEQAQLLKDFLEHEELMK